eukprot:m.93665 g.93665  ORF g.93665 m.93665 type:complete len:108 (-) comp16538_c0_seq3:59-382(-)
MSDEYSAMGGGLKLKGAIGKKKKKKTKKDKAKLLVAAVAAEKSKQERGEALTAEYDDSRTEAQKKFDKVQQEREYAKIKSKAQKSHKEKVDVSIIYRSAVWLLKYTY